MHRRTIHIRRKARPKNRVGKPIGASRETRSCRFRESFTILRNAGKRSSTRIKKRSMIPRSYEPARAWLFHRDWAGSANARKIENEKNPNKMARLITRIAPRVGWVAGSFSYVYFFCRAGG